MPHMIQVRFLKHNMPYHAGELAWFNEPQTQALVKQKFAEIVEPQPEFEPAARREMVKDVAAGGLARKELAAMIGDAVADAIAPVNARLAKLEAAAAEAAKDDKGKK